VDESAAPVESAIEYGHPVYSAWVRMPRGGKEQFAYTWTVADA
jgi:hypothetical protein